MIFNGVLVDPMEMVHLVRKQILEFRAAQVMKREEASVHEPGNEGSFAGQLVRWRRPAFGVLKFNCDGAWCAKTCKGGYGWVLRDFAGLLHAAGGEGGLFFSSTIVAEAAAIRAALQVCCEMGVHDVELESDSQLLIQMINGNYGIYATLECFIYDINQLVSQIGRVRFLFVKRDENAAHSMALFVASHGGTFCWDALELKFLFNILTKDVSISNHL